MARRLIFILGVGFALLQVASACVGGSDDTPLNPQPLPPVDPPGRTGDSDETQNPGTGDPTGSSTSSGGSTSSSAGGSPNPHDGGDGGDASSGDQ